MKIAFATCEVTFLCLMLSLSITSHEVNLLSSVIATSDLQGWLIQTYIDDIIVANSSIRGWEEVSIPYGNETVRGFQVCPEENDPAYSKMQSWLRTPPLFVKGIDRIYIEMNFWMRECNDLKNTMCRETFKVYYHRRNESSNGILNNQFYHSIDTVAAETRFFPSENPENLKINQETVSLTTFNEDVSAVQKKDPFANVVYIAIVDEGACMSLTSVRVYYKVCPQVVDHLAHFPRTYTGPHDTSLVKVFGRCVEDSSFVSSHMVSNQAFPLYHCTSSGAWNVRTGYCRCNPGFEPDFHHISCNKCPMNFSKSTIGNIKCTPCPPNSFTAAVGATFCQCFIKSQGLHSSSSAAGSALLIHDCELCSNLPSSPANLLLVKNTHVDADSIQLSWNAPEDFGRCNKITYCVFCQACSFLPHENSCVLSGNRAHDNHSNTSTAFLPFIPNMLDDNCDGLKYYPRRCDIESMHVTVDNLRGQTRYSFTVLAVNGVTAEQYSEVLSSTLEVAKSSNSGMIQADPIQLKVGALLPSISTVYYTSYRTLLPTEVHNVRLVRINQTSATLEWKPPLHSNGKLVGYQVTWRSLKTFQKNTVATSDFIPGLSTSTANVTGTTAVISPVDAGRYEVFVRARNSAGMGNFSLPLSFQIFSRTVASNVSQATPVSAGLPNYTYVIVAVVLIVLVISVALIGWFKRPSQRNKPTSSVTSAPRCNVEPVAFSQLPISDNEASTTSLDQRTYVDPFSLGALLPTFKCETNPELVALTSVIGCGEFGEVYQGTLVKEDRYGKQEIIEVAVKQLHAQCEPHEQFDFLREAMALEAFQHPNIIKLEAVVTASRPFMIMTDLMRHGCLGTFLKNHQNAGLAFSPIVLVRMLRGVASGMAYLSQLNYVHRDLAARNVLINDDLVCKVADFGLTRRLGEGEKEGSSTQTCTIQGGKIAIRWAAPEAIAHRAYSQASDVWSFGVFAWEVTTYGEKPYWNLTNRQVLQAVNEGFRLPAPEDCPSVLHQLMLECWHCDRHTRPTFVVVVAKLDEMLLNSNMLNALASPASTGAEEMFFAESPPHTPLPVFVVPDGQPYHKYTICEIATEDQVSVASHDNANTDVLAEAPCSSHPCSFTATSNADAVAKPLLPVKTAEEESAETAVLLHHSSSSDSLHHPFSSCSNAAKYVRNGDGAVKFIENQ